MKTLRIIMGLLLAGGVLPLAGPAAAQTTRPPQRIQLDSLSRYFAGVDFDHAGHVDLAEDCSVCHHHTTGAASSDPNCGRCHATGSGSGSVSCQGCHPAEPFSAAYLQRQSEDSGRYHLDKPGLKAAYHRNCLDCHEVSGGPTGCQDCHLRTAAGDALYRAGRFAPQARPGRTEH